jgi:hypothetical protein
MCNISAYKSKYKNKTNNYNLRKNQGKKYEALSNIHIHTNIDPSQLKIF